MSILTKEERAAMRARIENATEDPWFNWVENNAVYAGVAIENTEGSVSPSGEPIYEDHMSSLNDNGPSDAEFIAHARQDLPRALDTIDALEAENKELLHRAEAAEATQDAVAMMLEHARNDFEDPNGIMGPTWVARAAMRCPPVEEARERTRKAAEAFDQLLHPNGKCTCHGEGRCEWCSRDRVEVDTGLEAELHEAEHRIKVLEAELAEAHSALDAYLENAEVEGLDDMTLADKIDLQERIRADFSTMLRASLEQIRHVDALAENARRDLAGFRRVTVEVYAHREALEESLHDAYALIDNIRAYALERRASRGIGDHARALDEIARVAGGDQ